MIGETISHYKILEKLGEGGMGVVYKAQDTILEHPVAIKFLPPHLERDEEAARRFIHEAKAASALDHPNIATILEVERTPDGRTFIVMAYYEGETLRERIDRGEIPVDEALSIASQVASGLARAHETEIVHRDVKPSNIIVTKRGAAKIIDFGLAKLAGRTRLTREGSTLGTAAYMSPEQAKGEEADHRSDIFSLGCVLYELLTGEPPFKGEHEAALLYEIVHENHEPVSKARAGVPPDVERIVDRCLAKERAQRYQKTADLATDLNLLLGKLSEKFEASRGGSPGETRTSSRRWLMTVPFAVIAVLLVVLKIWSPGEKSDDAGSESGPITGPRPNWILVAEFDGPMDEPELAAAVRDLVIAVLHESRLVTPLSRADLKQGLTQAMKPDTTRVEGEIARELAYRAGARTYVEGKIGRLASGYSIVFNVMDAETGGYVLPVAGTAENKDAVIPAVDRLVRELRRKIGENRPAVEATRPAVTAITPSFDAYLEYLEALRLHGEMNYGESSKRARAALELDPDFASAWITIGYCYLNRSKEDSARAAFEEALERPDRLTDEARLAAAAAVEGFIEWELNAALDKWTQLVRRYNRWHTNRSVILAALGRIEESYEMDRMTLEMAPFGPSDLAFFNLATFAVALGRYEEARDAIDKMRQPRKDYLEICLATALFDWKRADSIAASSQMENRPRGVKYRVARDVSRGSIGSAVRRYPEIWDYEGQGFNHHTCLWTLHLSAITGLKRLAPQWPACSDTSMSGLIIEGVRAASAGDIALAESVLGRIRKKPSRFQRKHMVDIAFVEASLAREKEHWDEVIRVLESHARGGPRSRLCLDVPIRWMVAEAHEKQGNPEKAAGFFELVLSPAGITFPWEHLVRVSYCSLAHNRLVLLYSQLGRAAEAEEHLRKFEELFTDPDPEVQWMLDEARSAAARSRGPT